MREDTIFQLAGMLSHENVNQLSKKALQYNSSLHRTKKLYIGLYEHYNTHQYIELQCCR